MRKKLLSVILALCMVIALLPVSALANEPEAPPAEPAAQENTGEAQDNGTSSDVSGNAETGFSLSGSKVEEITKTATISGSGTAETTITVNPVSKLVWYPAQANIGRSSDGWWIGFWVYAPTSVTIDSNNSSQKIPYYNYNGQTLSQEKNFAANKDGVSEGNVPYMQCWGGVSEQYLNTAFKDSTKDTLTYSWYFNWDGDESTGPDVTVGDTTVKGIDQTVTLTFDLKDCQLLGKPAGGAAGTGSESQIWPRNFEVTSGTGESATTAYYTALPDAVANAPTNSTIKMLNDVEGPGIQILSSVNKTLTIDFGTHTYICNTPTGSKETQGVHLQKGNTITLKNGTIAASAKAKNIKALMQNYGNLTLENMTLDGSNLEAGNIGGVVFPKDSSFVLNCYNGTVSMTNTAIIDSKNGTPYSIGCGWWPSGGYSGGTQITVNDGCTFHNVLIYRDDTSQSAGQSGANSTIKLGDTTYALKYEDATSPNYMEFAKSGNELVPVLPEAALNYTALADKEIVSDCADKTMWVKFDEPLPGNTWLWFDISNGTTTYGIAAHANATKNTTNSSTGTTTKFAWSFLNQGQFESWPENVDGIESGEWTVTCYLAAGKIDKTKPEDGNLIELWSKTVNVQDLTPVVADPVVNADAIAKEHQETVTAAAKNVGMDDENMTKLSGEAYDAVANSSTPPTTEQGKTALTTVGITVNDGDTVNLVVQTYMDVAVTEYTPAVGDTSATLTYEITPMYRVVATTAVKTEDIKVNGETTGSETANAAVVGSAQKLSVTQSVEVTVGLPTGFVAKDAATSTYPNVYVQHKGHEYTAAVTETTSGSSTTLTASFTNPDGFSAFTITAKSVAVAKIGTASYTALQGAVDNVENDGIITVLKGGLSATVKKAITFTVKTEGTGVTQPTITADSGYTATQSAVDGGVKYTIKKNSSGGGTGTGSSGSSSSSGGSYAISTPSGVTGGTVRVSPSSASQGSKVTITATPDSGYEVGSITVTDKDGKQITVTSAGDHKYTFTMPKSKVDVKVEFVRQQTQPETNFVDVPSGAYYAGAVAWAVAQNITNGTTATTFSPEEVCTRAQMVTFLWRAAGSPKVSGSNPFTDVSAGEYYYDAVLWAVSRGITNGTTATTFSPNETVTRGQTVTFLYRAAGSPVSGSTIPFVDVPAGAYYTGAIQWAVGKGVTNGTTATTFGPEEPCTRGQIVTFLYRDRVN